VREGSQAHGAGELRHNVIATRTSPARTGHIAALSRSTPGCRAGKQRGRSEPTGWPLEIRYTGNPRAAARKAGRTRMTAYEITEPLRGSRCGTTWCAQVATVRVVGPGAAVNRVGGGGPPAEEKCGLCWDVMRGQLTRAGHTITDTTGSLERLRAEFSGFRVFRSDEGVLYAAVNGRTYHAYLATHMRSRLEQLT